MNKNNEDVKSLYVHIPFCDHICHYCDFTKIIYNETFASKYIDALFNEIDSYDIKKVDTIYVGGGTPTSLNDDLFLRLMEKLQPLLDDNAEFSVEANVESLTPKKLQMMVDHGVNRISIGVESTNNETLKYLGRKHTFEDVKNAVKLVKSMNIPTINLDLIYGYPGQSLEDLNKDLLNLFALDVDHYSIYSLTVNEGTKFFNDHVNEQNQDDSASFYETILKEMRDRNYVRYEVSNFARNNKYCRHNLAYWKDEHYFGVGLGASSYLADGRFTNTKNLNKYLSGQYGDYKEKVTLSDDLTYYLFLNLRLEQGFSLTEFKNRFDLDFMEHFKNQIERFGLRRYFIIDGDHISLNDDGMLILDTIITRLI